MAHEVQFTIPTRELGRSDVEFAVTKDGELLGTLKVSKGSLVWLPKHTREGHKATWAEFDEIMIAHAKATERR